MIRYLATLILVVLLCGCVLNADLEVPPAETLPVLNGILHPDSTISVSLTLTEILTKKSIYTEIDNAHVILYEDGILSDTLQHAGKGKYRCEKKPKPGSVYKVTANIPDYSILEAEDTMPVAPVVDACFKKSTFGDVLLYDVTVDLKIYTKASAAHWIEFVTDDYYKEPGKPRDTTKLVSEKMFYIYSDSPTVDNFNGLFDNTFGMMQYVLFLRVSPGLANPTVSIRGAAGRQSSPFFDFGTISNVKKGQSLRLNVFAVSEAYDRYLKSTTLDFVSTELEGIPVPFSGPVKIYSNVRNGVGIFAAINYSQIRVEQNPCD